MLTNKKSVLFHNLHILISRGLTENGAADLTGALSLQTASSLSWNPKGLFFSENKTPLALQSVIPFPPKGFFPWRVLLTRAVSLVASCPSLSFLVQRPIFISLTHWIGIRPRPVQGTILFSGEAEPTPPAGVLRETGSPGAG